MWARKEDEGEKKEDEGRGLGNQGRAGGKPGYEEVGVGLRGGDGKEVGFGLRGGVKVSSAPTVEEL